VSKAITPTNHFQNLINCCLVQTFRTSQNTHNLLSHSANKQDRQTNNGKNIIYDKPVTEVIKHTLTKALAAVSTEDSSVNVSGKSNCVVAGLLDHDHPATISLYPVSSHSVLCQSWL